MAQWRRSSTRFSSSAPGERVVGFHRMTADGLGHGMLAQPQGIEFPPGGFEFIRQFEHEPAGVRGFHKRRQGIEQERALAKFAQADTQPRQRRQLFPQETRVPRRELHGFRQEQSLGGRLVVAVPAD